MHNPRCRQPPLPTKTSVESRIDASQRTAAVQSAPTVFDTYKPLGRSLFSRKGGWATTQHVAAAKSYVHCAADIPNVVKEHQSAFAAPSQAYSTTSRATCGMTTSRAREDFFSYVRQVEKVDDAKRHGLDVIPTRSGASRNMRTTEIMRKREEDETFQPPTASYVRTERRPLNGLPALSATEAVKFVHVHPQSSGQLDYATPQNILPPSLDTSHVVQRRIPSETASTRDLFAGTSKARAAVIPGYVGHIPQNARNLRRMIGGEEDVRRTFSKTVVSYTKSASLPPRSNVDRAATMQGIQQEQCLRGDAERALNYKRRIGQ